MKNIFWLFPVVVVAVFGWRFLNRELLVNRIECFTQYGYCPNNYLAKLDVFKKTPLISRLPKKQITQVLQSYSEIKKLDVYRRLPETLVVSVTLRKPVSGISDSILGWHSGIDSEGQVFSIDPSSPLPLIITDRSYQPGDNVGTRLTTAGLFLSEISALTPNRLIGQVTANRLIFAIGSTQVVVDLDNSPSNWPSSLQSILNRSKIGPKFPKIIDLRFSQPVLTY